MMERNQIEYHCTESTLKLMKQRQNDIFQSLKNEKLRQNDWFVEGWGGFVGFIFDSNFSPNLSSIRL